VNLSGRGDKDVHTAGEWFGLLDKGVSGKGVSGKGNVS
jgi:hypothetical protein